MSLLDIENTLIDIRDDIREVKIIVNSRFKWLLMSVLGSQLLFLVAEVIKAFHLI